MASSLPHVLKLVIEDKQRHAMNLLLQMFSIVVVEVRRFENAVRCAVRLNAGLCFV